MKKFCRFIFFFVLVHTSISKMESIEMDKERSTRNVQDAENLIQEFSWEDILLNKYTLSASVILGLIFLFKKSISKVSPSIPGIISEISSIPKVLHSIRKIISSNSDDLTSALLKGDLESAKYICEKNPYLIIDLSVEVNCYSSKKTYYIFHHALMKIYGRYYTTLNKLIEDNYEVVDEIDNWKNIVKFILDYDIDILHKETSDCSPIFYPIVNNDIDMARLFIEKGASYTTYKYGYPLTREVNPSFGRKSYICSLLHELANNDIFFEIAKLLIYHFEEKNLSFVIHYRDSNNLNPVHYAMRNGSVKIFNLLVENGADPFNYIDCRSETEICNSLCKEFWHFAAMGGNIEILEYIKENFELDVDVDCVDENGLSPLYYAITYNDENVSNVCNFLIELDFKFNEEDKKKFTRGLNCNYLWNNTTIKKNSIINDALADKIQYLIEKCNDESLFFNQTLLHQAILNDASQLFEFIINYDNFDLEKTERYGRSALYYAFKSDNASFKQALIDKDLSLNDADIAFLLVDFIKNPDLKVFGFDLEGFLDYLSVQNFNLENILNQQYKILQGCFYVLGHTILYCAVEHNHEKVIDFCLDNGAKFAQKEVEELLFEVIYKDDLDNFKFFVKNSSQDFELNEIKDNDKSLLVKAFNLNRKKIFNYLFEKGLKFTKVDIKDLCILSEENNDECDLKRIKLVFNSFCSNENNYNKINNKYYCNYFNKYTLLYCAYKHKKEKCVKYLLNKGAKFNENDLKVLLFNKIKNNRFEDFKFVVENASEDIEVDEIKDDGLKTLLFRSYFNSKKEFVKYLEEEKLYMIGDQERNILLDLKPEKKLVWERLSNG